MYVAVTGPADNYEDIRENARRMDIYGDHYINNFSPCDNTENHNRFEKCSGAPQVNTPVGFLNNDDRWFTDPATINGALYYQTRLTFTANAQTGLTPELATFAMTWSK